MRYPNQFPLGLHQMSHLDISVSGFWGGNCERTFLDMKAYVHNNHSTNPKGFTENMIKEMFL